MEVTVKSVKAADLKCDAAVFCVFDDKKMSKILEDFDHHSMISALLRTKEFKGDFKDIDHIHLHQNIKKLILISLGKKVDFNANKLREIAVAATRYAKGMKLTSFHFIYEGYDKITDEEAGQVLAEGFILGEYKFDKYLAKKPDDTELSNVIINVLQGSQKSVENGAKTAEIVTDHMIFVKDLINEPPSRKGPEVIAERAIALCKKNKVKINVWDKKKIEKEGMEGVIGVNAGSVKEPRFLVVEYNNAPGNPIVLIGKGIVFDSGGLQLKPWNYMLDMKDDMSGAATVVGAINLMAALNMKVNVVGLAPVTENLTGGNAYKPGDVLKTYNGKTIEIGHTDAEGRVVLADALGYSRNFKPKAIIDMATLTGAIVVALGYEFAGLFSNDDKLRRALLEAGKHTDEQLWHMPLIPKHTEMIKGKLGDVKNVGSTEGAASSSTAAAFLQEFVPEKTPWAHLDIAATAFIKEPNGVSGEGATGYGIRLLVEFMKRYCN